jgi:predicted transcriptional regulator of viral defense system
LNMEKIDKLFNSPVVRFSSIERIAGSYAKLLVHNLVRQGRIHRLAKGCYTAHDESALLVHCMQPAYLGLQEALSFHNLWEQETIPVIITSARVRLGMRKVIGGNVLVKRISRKYMFGFDYYDSAGFAYPYSDIEKTLIDMAYFKEHLDRETLQNIKKRIKKRKLLSYLESYPQRTRKRVLQLAGE